MAGGSSALSLLGVIGTTATQIIAANQQGEFQKEQAELTAERARMAVESNVRTAVGSIRRETDRLNVAGADMKGATLEVRAAQIARNALTNARNKNFAIGQAAVDAQDAAKLRADTARLAAITSGVTGGAGLLSTGATAYKRNAPLRTEPQLNPTRQPDLSGMFLVPGS